MLIRSDEAPVVSTPNAVMRTYASPKVNGAPVAVWRTEMEPEARGPLHQATVDQVIVVLEGCLTATIASETVRADAEASIHIPAGVERQLANDGAGRLVMLTAAEPGGQAIVAGQSPADITWAA